MMMMMMMDGCAGAHGALFTAAICSGMMLAALYRHSLAADKMEGSNRHQLGAPDSRRPVEGELWNGLWLSQLCASGTTRPSKKAVPRKTLRET
eukprot:4397771-Amphidinium_carterae.1